MFLVVTLLFSLLLSVNAVLRNQTIDDTSDLVVFTGNWTTQDDKGGYFNRTNHLTYTNFASATLDFNGTAVYYIGTTNRNHGDLTCSLDGQTIRSTSQNAKGPLQAQVVLCSFTQLANDTQHTLIVSNTEQDAALDVDYFLVTFDDRTELLTDPKQLDESLVQRRNVSIDDTDLASIQYTGTWTVNTAASEQFLNWTAHTTNVVGSRATITFHGADAVYYIGTKNADHGVATCNMDDGRVVSFNSVATAFQQEHTFCGFDNLDPTKDHTMYVENKEAKFLDVDAFLLTVDYYPPPDTGKSSTSSTPTANGISPSDKEGSSKTGTIAGSIAGIVAGIAVLGLGLWWFFRKRGYRPKSTTYFANVTPNLLADSSSALSLSQTKTMSPVSSQHGYGTGSVDRTPSMYSNRAFFSMAPGNDIRNGHQLEATPLPYPGSLPPLQQPTSMPQKNDGRIESIYDYNGDLPYMRAGPAPPSAGTQRDSWAGYGGSPFPSRFPEIQGGDQQYGHR